MSTGSILGLIALLSSGDAAPPDSAYRVEIEAWRAKRVESLRRPDGWLTLAGLFWLEEGENRFGSDPSNRIVLPAGAAPAFLGVLLLSHGTVSVRVEPGAEVAQDGKRVASMNLKTDADGEPTVLKHGSISFYVIRRGKRLGVRVKNSRSPSLAAFHGVENFPIDRRWRLEARFEPYDPPRPIPIPNILGTVESEKSPGAVVFDFEGRAYRLDAVTESGTDELFLIFSDQTNGTETYGAGRFLYAAAPAGGKTVVDFNKAYNPPCVFTPYATCPLPPPQNSIGIRIEAGEKKYGEH
ncbi:MAG: DUF1684 domain-containing protein [Thermoanaerobaculia bacterium]